MGLFPEAAHIIIGDAVRNQAAQVPQKALAFFHRTDHLSLQDGKIFDRIISVGLDEGFLHVVGPVLAAGLITVFHHHFPGRPVLGRDPPQQFSDKGVVMGSQVLPAHLVHLQTRSFRHGRGIGDTRGFHVTDENGPLPIRHLPAQLSAAQQRGQVLQEHRVHAVPVIDIFRGLPQIGVPERKRLLEHLGEGFLRITGHVRLLGKGNGESAVGRVLQTQLIGSCRRFFQAFHPGSQRLESHVQPHIVTVIGKGSQFLAIQGKRNRCPLGIVAFQDKRTDGKGNRHFQDRRDSPAGFQRPAAGFPGDFPPGLHCNDAVGRDIRKFQQLFGPIAFHLLIMAGHILHALLRGDPGAAGLAPARTVEHADFDAQLTGLLDGRMGNVPPLVGEERNEPFVPSVGGLVADERPRNAHALHGLQVLHDTFLGNLVVQPVPVHGRPDGVRRCLESLLQGRPAGLTGTEKGDGCQRE